MPSFVASQGRSRTHTDTQISLNEILPLFSLRLLAGSAGHRIAGEIGICSLPEWRSILSGAPSAE